MNSNPFEERPPFKKNIVNISLTADQMKAVDELKEALGMDTRSALLKKLLRDAYAEYLSEG